MFRDKYLRYYPRMLGVVLLVTAILKVGGSFSKVPLLDSHDPLLVFATERAVLILAALAEFACVLALVLLPPAGGLWATTWLVLTFGLYRLGLHMLGAGGHICPCLGYWLPLTPEASNQIALGLLYFMLLGNICGLSICYKQPKTPKLDVFRQDQ